MDEKSRVVFDEVMAAIRSLRSLVRESLGAPRYAVTPGAALNSVIEETVDPAIRRGAELLERDEAERQKFMSGRFMRPGLTFAVGKTVEEMGELQAALGKTLRWGWSSADPTLPRDQQVTNLEWVRAEMADVRRSLDNLDRWLPTGTPVAPLNMKVDFQD